MVDAGAAGVATLRAWLAEFLAFYRRYGVVIRAWAENQVTDRALGRLGAASFERITTTLPASMTGVARTPASRSAGSSCGLRRCWP